MSRKRASGQLESKHVPYARADLPSKALQFLPSGPGDRLSVAGVRRFRAAARRDPETRLVVLGVLRAHSVNGAEAPLAGISLMFAAIAVFLGSTLSAPTGWLWLFWCAWGVALMLVAAWTVRVSLAAHARRAVATTWLGAYEDALRR